MLSVDKKKKLGNRLECSECSTKFYDLNKPNPACPSCGKPYVLQDKPKIKASKPVEIEIETSEEVEAPTEEFEMLSFDSADEDFQEFSEDSPLE